MINISYDLHIHSCLSPCGDDDMTPGNIVGMAALKQLDVVALTDHNTSRNCPAFMQLAKEYDVLAIPGMEVTTLEEVHVVCLFPTLLHALVFDRFIYDNLIKVRNNEDIFGKQQIMDAEDKQTGIEEYLLINSTNISFDAMYDVVKQHGGVMIPAHIDKNTTSVLSNLGFIPENSRFNCVEVKDMSQWHRLKASNPYLEKCKVISDSDAHYLEHINEPVNYITVTDKTIEGVLKALDYEWKYVPVGNT
ncbi:MAG: PHP domain-containing protein [Eubacterium sp.]